MDQNHARILAFRFAAFHSLFFPSRVLARVRAREADFRCRERHFQAHFLFAGASVPFRNYRETSPVKILSHTRSLHAGVETLGAPLIERLPL